MSVMEPPEITMKISRVGSLIQISGVIDEHSDFSTLLSESAPLSIDFSGVERVNSVGLRTWMRFMTQWGDKELIYLKCPVVIVDQLATIPALMGIKKRAALVQSADLAFECDKCGHQEDRCIDRASVDPTPDPSVLQPPCPSCGGTLELINEDQLVIFLPRS